MHKTFSTSFTALLVMIALLTFAPGQVRAASQVGNGSAASCSEAALRTAVAAENSITFNCGANPVMITLSSPLDVTKPNLTIDGGNLVTLSGGGSSQIIDHRTFGMIGSSVLTLKNLIIRDGYARGAGDTANGGAIKSYFQAADPAFKPTLNIENVSFSNNDSKLDSFTGGNAYDFGGGAIFSQGGQVNTR